MSDKVLSENDPEKRDAMIADVFKIMHDDVGYVPLHQQGLAWGVSSKVDLAQRADNVFSLQYVTKK